jgi:hypothetical protein
LNFFDQSNRSGINATSSSGRATMGSSWNLFTCSGAIARDHETQP